MRRNYSPFNLVRGLYPREITGERAKFRGGSFVSRSNFSRALSPPPFRPCFEGRDNVLGLEGRGESGALSSLLVALGAG